MFNIYLIRSQHHHWIERETKLLKFEINFSINKNVSTNGQFSIESLHERRKRKREFVLLIRIGKQNVEIKYK